MTHQKRTPTIEELLQTIEGRTGEIDQLGLRMRILSSDLKRATTQQNLDALKTEMRAVFNRAGRALRILNQLQSQFDERVTEPVNDAQICKNKGQFSEAWRLVSLALEVNPSHSDALQLKEEITRELEMVAWGLIAAAEKLLAEGEFEKAFETIDQEVVLPSPDPELESHLQKLKEALRQGQTATQVTPPDLEGLAQAFGMPPALPEMHIGEPPQPPGANKPDVFGQLTQAVAQTQANQPAAEPSSAARDENPEANHWLDKHHFYPDHHEAPFAD